MATKSKKTTARSPRAAAPVSAPKTPDGDPRLDRLKHLVSILEGSTLAELRYEDEDIAVELSRHSGAVVGSSSLMLSSPTGHAPAAPASAAQQASAAPAAAATPAVDKNVHVVRSPFVGTFYASPSPDAEAFTGVGKRVRRGQTLCIVEAMKLMNEIESEVDGLVVETIAENGKPVQYGDALFKIEIKAG
jgi:acetyl-CoA carboxylase biotin carboxyl carrier protein